MKYLYMTFFFGAISSNIQAQVNLSPKFFYGFQIGLLETVFYNEVNLTDGFSLKTGVGLVGGIDNSSFFATPKFELQPKWNFTKKKRFFLKKTVQYNASNYVTIALSYLSEWLTLSEYKNRANERIQLIPTIGFKRNYKQNLNVEFFLGLGYERILNQDIVKQNGFALKLGALIGFDF
ncbi:hypothetical protein [Myroides sp. DW712]|uniref:hypothetical protein n=1 Tax=Myroides sp. DW712 TaxID=3389800 RepID=UPI003979F52F